MKTADTIPTLTGLRAFAALWVFVLHACFGNVNKHGYFPAFDSKVEWGFLENFIMRGYLAVDIFFILSGFILAHVYGENFRGWITRAHMLDFYAKRLARIYPVHLFITLLLFGLFYFSLWQPVRFIGFGDVLLSASLLNVLRDPSVNIPAWSISAEWFAYLACPFVLWLVAKVRNNWILLGLVVVIGLAYPLWWGRLVGGDGLHGASAILRVMCDFVTGTILYRLYTNRAFTIKMRHGADILFVVSFAALFALATLKFPFAYLYPVLAFFLYYLALSETFVKKFFASRIMIFLGTVSYGIYMVHYPVLELFAGLFSDYFYTVDPAGKQGVFWLCFAGMTATTIAAATALYYGVEKPCRNWVTRRLTK